MIHYDIDMSKNHVEISMEGDLCVLATDTISLISGVYAGLLEQDKEAGLLFKEVIQNCINDESFFGTVTESFLGTAELTNRHKQTEAELIAELRELKRKELENER